MNFLYCPFCTEKLQIKKIENRNRAFCTHCKYIHYENPIPASATVILENDKILLVKRKYEPRAGYWSLPAGFIEIDESPEQAAIREVKEETGYDIHILGLVNVYSSCDDNLSKIVLIVYCGKITSGKLQPGDDASDAHFFPTDQLPEELAFSNHRQAINTVLGTLPNQI